LDIEDIHPLRKTADMKHIYPIFKICCTKKKKMFSEDLRKAMWAEMNIEQGEVDEYDAEKELNEDPYLILGYGVNAYFTFLVMIS
jgi:hypothetical protein